MSDQIQIEIEQHSDQTAIIHLAGDITSFSEQEVNEAYESISKPVIKNILFNFRENDYINSAGIAILIGIVTQARKNNQRLLMAMPSAHFQKIFRMVGLSQYADIYPSLEDAIRNL